MKYIYILYTIDIKRSNLILDILKFKFLSKFRSVIVVI